MKKAKTHAVSFRGKTVDLVYEDMGYEADCNAHVIEWSFADDALNCLRLTDMEEQDIYDQLRGRIDLADASVPEPEE
jgi:hypothetical protein